MKKFFNKEKERSVKSRSGSDAFEKIYDVMFPEKEFIHEGDEEYIDRLIQHFAIRDNVSLSKYTPEEIKMTSAYDSARRIISEFNMEYNTQGKNEGSRSAFLNGKIHDRIKFMRQLKSPITMAEKTAPAIPEDERHNSFDIKRSKFAIEKVAVQLIDYKNDSEAMQREKKELVEKFKHRPLEAIQKIIAEETKGVTLEKESGAIQDAKPDIFERFKNAKDEAEKSHIESKEEQKVDPMARMRAKFDEINDLSDSSNEHDDTSPTPRSPGK